MLDTGHNASSYPATLDELLQRHQQRILFACVSGSRAYGTVNAESDTDIRGIYAQPARQFLALNVPEAQITDARHDVVYYSLRRTLELLASANPNLLELLYMPGDCIQVDTPEMQRLRECRSLFITRQCVDSHIGYALGQIKKARGQNKWINQPKDEAPPRREDYCHILLREALSTHNPPCRPVPLARSGIRLEHCHAARLEHARDIYRLYEYGAAARGVFRDGSLALESVPREHESSHFVGLLLYNEQAWRQAGDEHRNYWTWRRERNEARWRQQEAGELDYDAKNLMHTLRLLLSGESILLRGEPIVRFEGQALERLLAVRAGRVSYQEVIAEAEQIKARCTALRSQADLPESVDPQTANQLLLELTGNWEQRCL